MEIKQESDNVRVSNEYLQLDVATAFGPRITGFSLPDGENRFAELGDLSIDLPDGRAYRLRGGHRLWAAPEVPATTYEPDDEPVSISETTDGIALTHGAGDTATIEQTLAVALRDEKVVLSHTLTNRGEQAVEVAPWTITSLRSAELALFRCDETPPMPTDTSRMPTPRCGPIPVSPTVGLSSKTDSHSSTQIEPDQPKLARHSTEVGWRTPVTGRSP